MEALDGNAIGGMLYQVFGGEMTMAQAECGRCGARGPLFLAAGGSGVAPMRAILRHRRNRGSDVRARLLYSSRRLEDVIYRTELDREDVVHTLTRERPPGWTGYARRVDVDLLREVAWPARDRPLAFVCGPTSFVESVAAGLVALDYPPGGIKTERFGATGGR